MRLNALFAVTVLLALAFMPAGCATSGAQPQAKMEVVLKNGETVLLFHGGTQEAKSLFCVGETLPVYRAYPLKRLRYLEVGKVKITSAVGEHYLEGVVVQGEVKNG